MKRKTSIFTTVIAIAAIFAISTPFFSSLAAGTAVTVQTDASSYPAGQAGTHVMISGTVSPVPGQSGYQITLEVNTSQGQLAVYSVPVDGTSGAYSYTLVTGYAVNGWINGTYTIKAVYASSVNGPTYTASTTFQYGASATTSSTTTSTTSSVSTVTTTVSSTVTTTASTTATVTQSTTVTTATTVTSTSTAPGTTSTLTVTTASSNGTDLGIGIAGIIAAVVVAGASAFLLRKH
ncbi:MAG: hypothetical protein ACRDF4_07925 [Rhabdochlamydiaceae bacterium]